MLKFAAYDLGFFPAELCLLGVLGPSAEGEAGLRCCTVLLGRDGARRFREPWSTRAYIQMATVMTMTKRLPRIRTTIAVPIS